LTFAAAAPAGALLPFQFHPRLVPAMPWAYWAVSNYELLIEKGADDLLMMTGYSTIMKIKDLKKRLKL
jgi:hypothetical protein